MSSVVSTPVVRVDKNRSAAAAAPYSNLIVGDLLGGVYNLENCVDQINGLAAVGPGRTTAAV